MSMGEWVFLGDKLASLDDIDAALSAADNDSNRDALGYVARIDHLEFYKIKQPDFASDDVGIWQGVAQRLKGAHLVLLPFLPAVIELYRSNGCADVVNVEPLIFYIKEDGTPSFRSIDSEKLLQIRQSDLFIVAGKNSKRSVLTVDNGHFSLPSGAHTSHFFRLAECLSSIDDIDRLVYWIARDIHQKLRITNFEKLFLLADNPSTLILALRTAQLFPKIDIYCDCLRAYPEGRQDANELREWIDGQLKDCSAIHSIISVSSTGALSKILSDAVEHLKKEISFSILYSTTADGVTEPHCILNVEGYKHFEKESSCELCRPPLTSAVFQIDKERYFLSERQIDLISMPISFFKSQKSFLEAYGGFAGVLQVHVDDPNDESHRHHAFYIDVRSLLNVPAFCGELEKKIGEIGIAPDVIVLPPHATGQAIGAYLKSLKFEVFYHRDLRLNVASADDQAIANAISKSRSLLIIDDAAFTGRRIQTFNKALRESADIFQCPAVVTFFPLMVMTDDQEKWNTTVRGLTAHHDDQIRQVISLYTFVLPSWGEDECPWCEEGREISALPTFSKGDADDRGTMLQDTELGLRGISWINHAEEIAIPALGGDSPILKEGVTAIQVLFSCASAVQQIRTRLVKKLAPNGFPSSTLLSVSVIKDFQNETLLIVALLRCLQRNEVEEPFRKHLSEKTEAFKTAPHLVENDHWALREFLLAELRGIADRIEDANNRKHIYGQAKFSEFYTE